MDFTYSNIIYRIPSLDMMDMEYILSKAKNPDKELSPIWNINEDKSKKFSEFKMFAQHRGETVDEDSYENDNIKMDFTYNNIMYTIPLDTMDMDYILSKARNPGKELLPIWNINEDKSKKFCEFKMFALRRGETIDKVSYENANYAPPRDHIHVQTRRQRQKRKKRTLGKQTPVSSIDKLSTGPVPAASCTRKDAVVPRYYCNVCNVDIPITYMDQHTSSKKHTICSKIVDICVERAKSNLKPTQGWEKKTDSRSYFCNPCCVVVKKIERREHELTKSHFKSLMQERFLYDLLQIFIDKEHLENVDFEYMNNDQFNEYNDYNSLDDSDSYSDYDDDDIDIFAPQTSNLIEKNVETTSRVKNLTSAQNVEQKPESDTNVPNNPMNLEDYIEMINATSKLSNAPLVSVKDDHVRIVTSDKHVLCVPEDNFHGFTRIEQWTTCRLCLKAVNNEEESHKMTKEHIKLLFTPIPDKHGVREMHSVIKHCVLCNDHFYDLQQHKQSVTHKEALEDSLKRVINPTIINQPRGRPKIVKKYCYPCSCYIDEHNYNSHVRGKPHLAKAKLFAGRPKNAALILNHHHLKFNKNIATCTVCNIELRTRETHSHVINVLHIAKYSNLLADNNITNLEGMMLYCNSCDTPIKDDKDLLHINSVEHKRNLTGVNVATPHIYNCKICNVKVPNTLYNIETHINGKCHRNIAMRKQVRR